MSNVKLAIRVRPFTDKENKSEIDRTPVVSVVDDNIVTITNVKVNASGAGDSRKRVRRFHADCTFDSACSPTHPNYASQDKVFDKIGRQVLTNILRGQSACVLTYGQSATGKTHTMMGTTAQPGLIPRICMALAEERPVNITVSFLEIYNERVHDLLAGEVLPANSLPRRTGNVRKDLRVREHPTKGPYVQNLRLVEVHDAESLLAVVNEGIRRRRTAKTRRNVSSSRSHALLELVTPHCKLHLADLAGSEKSGGEGCGGRQKEGANINKSLVALSNVISALVSGGAGRGRFVPYRDSALTWLLKDCFTGGGSVFIIATVSPSAACYSETASTLRWADRARQLPTQRPLAAPNVISKAALQSQLSQLIAELARNFIHYKPETGKLSYGEEHWSLQINKKQNNDIVNKNVKIGNIMNYRYPKIDARNSESTPSSIASGSSDIINNMDNSAEISNEINKEIDKLFGPALERTRSGSDIDVAVPLKYSKRQFRSQEVLHNDKLHGSNQEHRLSDAGLKEIHQGSLQKTPDILYDNQRAEIIASVTDRLYSKLKKNDNSSKVESVTEKKAQNDIMNVHSLNELKICSNARQRLMDLSKKALRNKRKIGIPAHTQTRKSAIRVREQGVDIQTDLQPYKSYGGHTCRFRQDVSTETISMTPRLKEVSVGPKFSNLNFNDASTITDNKQVVYRSSSVMTDIVSLSDRCTQTLTKQVPKRRKRTSVYSKYVKKIERMKSSTDESSISHVININISPMLPADSDSLSSDETAQIPLAANSDKHNCSATTTPDLLSNHNNIIRQMEETHIVEDSQCNATCGDVNTFNEKTYESTDFSDEEHLLPLPRVTVDSDRNIGEKDYFDLIMGRNDKIYPYNIKLSPVPRRNNTKRAIRFKDIDVSPTKGSKNQWKSIRNNSLSKNSARGKESLNDSESDSSHELDSKMNWIKTNPKRGHYQNDFNKIINTDKVPTFYKQCSKFKNNKDSFDASRTGLKCNDNFENKANFNQKKLKEDYEDSSFDVFEEGIENACRSLESSVDKYRSYLNDFHGNPKYNYMTEDKRRTPKKYLQHLINLRKEAVKSDYLG